MSRASLQTALDHYAAPMALSRDEGGGRVRCLACGHRCLIPEGRRGVCRVRFNRAGTLYGPWEYVTGLQNDPIERKPFFHVLPGSRSFSFGMLGCSYHCGYCQNWLTSQALKEEAAGSAIYPVTAEKIVAQAKRHGALTVASTYNEPLITAEWAEAVFRPAKAAGFRTLFISNGHNTQEAIDFLRPWLDCCNVDLKTFRDRSYRTLGGTLKGVLEGIERIRRAGMWMEVITLVVPGFNDSDDELRDIAEYLVGLSPDVPWHVSAFFPSYHMMDTPATPPATLMRAYEIGKAAGLRYVYAGNLPARVRNLENTYCPDCGALLVERSGVRALGYHLRDGRCPNCGAAIPGVWHTADTLPGLHLAGSGAWPDGMFSGSAPSVH